MALNLQLSTAVCKSEYSRVEGTFNLVQHFPQWAKTSLTRLSCSEPHPTWLNLSRVGAYSTFLSNSFQHLIILTVKKKAFLLSSLNLPPFSLQPVLLVLLQPCHGFLSCFKLLCSNHLQDVFWHLILKFYFSWAQNTI